jgi:hypothetical protein
MVVHVDAKRLARLGARGRRLACGQDRACAQSRERREKTAAREFLSRLIE